jgi:hypothetical protein
MPKSSEPRYLSHWQKQTLLKAIRRPDELTDSEGLCISCTQTELPAAQQRRLVGEWCERLPTLSRVRILWFDSQVPQNLFDAACRMKNLVSLWIKWSSIKNLAEIDQCRSLRHLHVGSSAQIQSIDALGAMTDLRSMSLWNLKRISDFSPLSPLTGLEELAISGGLWGLQKVHSLAAFAELESLKLLNLGGVKCLDGSLRPLDRLRRLQRVVVNSGEYAIEELAWLSVRFAKIDHGVRPYSDFSGNYGFLPCKKCSSKTMVLLFGKGRCREICKNCDAKKLAEHLAYFDQCVAALSSTGSRGGKGPRA